MPRPVAVNIPFLMDSKTIPPFLISGCRMKIRIFQGCREGDPSAASPESDRIFRI
jgi:hypothetical protein